MLRNPWMLAYRHSVGLGSNIHRQTQTSKLQPTTSGSFTPVGLLCPLWLARFKQKNLVNKPPVAFEDKDRLHESKWDNIPRLELC